MTLQELLTAIREERDSFPDAQKLAADYVLKNYSQIPFLSISTLSHNIGVSDNTIIKFCNRLGFARFREFKTVFSEYAHSELSMYNKISSDGDSQKGAEIFALGLAEDTAVMEATLNNTHNQEMLPLLSEKIIRAGHIYILGGRASGILAEMLTTILRYLGLKVHYMRCGIGDLPDRLSLIEQGDLLIAFSFPRYTAQVINALSALHDAGVTTAVFTDNSLSPAVAHADLAMYCSVDSGYYFPSYTGCLALLNVVCRTVAADRKVESAEHIRKLESTLLNQGTFI